jgi:hypothetical protein
VSIVISESLVRKYHKTQNPPFRGFIQKTPTYNPVTGQWIKRDGTTGQFLDVKQDGEPFKSVRKEDPA